MTYDAFSSILADIIIKRNIEIEYEAAVRSDTNDLYNISCECIGNINSYERYKKKLYNRYEIRKQRLKHDLRMDVKSDNLDCHKVAAVVLFSILDLKPVKFSLKNVKSVAEICDDVKLVNYKIAFRCACGVIFSDMIEELKNKNYFDERDVLLKNGGLFMPKVRAGLPPYFNNYSKILLCNDKRIEKFTDYLEIADTMFLIELLNYKKLFPTREIVV